MTLIERLEAATGPDRELGNEVLFECGWMLREEGGGPDRATIWIPPSDRFNDEFLDGDQPNPTASIDAAMMLVPEGCVWALNFASMATIMKVGTKKFDIIDGVIVGQWPENQREGGLPVSVAIAFCIAALKARGADNEN